MMPLELSNRAKMEGLRTGLKRRLTTHRPEEPVLGQAGPPAPPVHGGAYPYRRFTAVPFGYAAPA